MSIWKTPADLKYQATDEWLRIEGDEAVIGITDYAQDQLNDVVFVEMARVGQKLTKGAVMGTVESVKAASELVAPVSFEVIAVNAAAEDDPELLNTDPYGQGWLVRVRLDDVTEADTLMDADAYSAYCQDR